MPKSSIVEAPPLRPANPPALVYAAALGRADIVELLLKAGARIDDADTTRQTACHVAAICDARASGACAQSRSD
jgi:ankyrin repeat protein